MENLSSKHIIDKFLRYSTEAMCVIDTDLIIHNVNPQWENSLGYMHSESINQPISNLLYTKDLENFKNGIKKLADNQIDDIKIQIQFKPKHSYYCNFICHLFTINGYIVFSLIFTNSNKTHKKDVPCTDNETFEKYELFKASIDNANDAIYWINEQGGFEYVNTIAYKNLGYTKEELMSLSITNIDPDLTNTNFLHLWESFQQHRDQGFFNRRFEARHIRKDGTIYPIEVYTTHFWKNEKEYHIAHVRDITERKAEEKRVKDSEEKYRSLFKNMTSSFALHKLIYDQNNKPIDYIYEEVNPVFEKYTGLKHETVIGKRARALHPKMENYWVEFFGEVALTGVPKTIVNYSQETGKYFEAYAFRTKEGYCAAIFNDVTERVKNEDALRKSEEKYRQLFENITAAFSIQRPEYNSDGIAVDYTFIEVNPAFEQKIGMTSKQLTGKSAKELFPKTEDYWIQLFGEVAKTGQPQKKTDYSIELDRYFEFYAFCPEKGYCACMFNDVTDRIKNEKTLQKFKASIDNSLDGIYWINKNGEFEYVNEAACKMLGYSYDELIQLNILDIDPEGDTNSFTQLWKSLQHNKKFEAFSSERTHLKKNGSIFPVELNTVFLWENNEGFLISYAKDITERKQHEASILKSQKLLNDSQKAGLIGSWEHNLETGELTWNEQIYNIFGLDQSFVPTYEKFLELIHPDERDTLEIKYKDSIKNGKFETNEYRIVRPDNSIRQIKIMGNIEYAEDNKASRTFGVVQDITEQKKTEENLKWFKTSIDKASDAIYWINKDAQFEYVNEIASKNLGYSQEELLQMTVFDVDPSATKEKWDAQWLTFGPEHNNSTVETIHQRKNATVYPIEALNNYFCFNDKEYIIAYIRDITERKQYEEDLFLFKNATDNSNDAVFLHAQDGTLQYVNHQACKMLGYTREELLQLTIYDIDPVFTPQQMEEHWENCRKHKNEGSYSQRIESFHKRKDGTVYPVDISSTHFWINDKEYHIAYAQDISERKQHETALIESEKRARLFAEKTPLPIAMFDTEMRYITASKIYKSTFKITDRNIIGESHYDVFPNISNQWKKEHQRAINGEVIKCNQAKYVYPDGTGIWLRYELHPWYKDDKTPGGMVIFSENITEKLATEKALKQSEQKSQRIFEVAPVGIGITKNRIISDLNPQACKITGYTKEELIGKSTRFAYLSDEDFENTGKVLYQILEDKGIGGIETVWKRKDGNLISVHIAITLLDPNDRDKGTIFTVMDITEQKNYEEQLLINQKLLLESQRIAKMGSWELDLESNEISWNKETYSIYDIDDLSITPSFEIFNKLIHPDDFDSVHEHIKSVLKVGKTKDLTFRIITPKGNLKHILVAGELLRDTQDNPLQLYGIVQDITEQKHYEQELIKEKEHAKESEERFKALHNASFGGITIHDKGRILDCNRGLSEITGYSYDELIGMDGLLLIAEEYRDTVRQNIQNKNEKPYEVICTRKNGERYPVRLEAREIPYRGKRVRTVEFRDITTEKEIENQLKQMNVILEQKVEQRTSELSQANKDLEAFAYSVSHDLRAPIRHIDGFMQLLKNTIDTTEPKTKNYLNKISIATNGMSVMIDELLKFSRLGRTELTLKEVDLTKITKEVIDQFKPDYAHRNIQWQIDDLQKVMGDPILLKVVMENLISNAIKYTSKKDIAIIEVKEYKSDNNFLTFYVKDNGAGFDEAYKNKLFGVFQRLHKNDEFEGIGIGLANVKQIIFKHKGNITAEGVVDEGATFYISLPK